MNQRTVSVAIAALALASCNASGRSSEGTRELGHDDLVRVMLTDSAGSRTLSLVANAGVKINARLKPSIERESLPPIEFDAPGRTEDSSYFLSSPLATIDNVRPFKGTLRASACPEGKRVCISVAVPIELR